MTASRPAPTPARSALAGQTASPDVIAELHARARRIAQLETALVTRFRDLDEALHGIGRLDPSMPEVAWLQHLDRVRGLVEIEDAAIWMREVAHSNPTKRELADAVNELTQALHRAGGS